MDNVAFERELLRGCEALGVSLPREAVAPLQRLSDELIRWNAKVNLTAITAPAEVLEKHLLDSLAVLPELGETGSVLDLGSGAGFPGLPAKIARPGLDVTMVDAVAKKIGFTKHVIAQFRLGPQCRAIHARAEGDPAKDKLPVADRVVSRALMDLPEWLSLAKHYVRPGGRVVAMLGKAPETGSPERLAAEHGLALAGVRAYRLPFSGAERHVIVFSKA